MKNFLISFSTALLCSMLFCGSCRNNNGSNNSGRSSEANALLQQLSNTIQRGFMFGHHDDPVYGHIWYLDSGRSDVKEVCGDMPALLSFDLGRIEFARENPDGFAAADSNLDRVPFSRMREEIIKHYEKGGVITLSWHAANPITGGGSWDVGDSSVQTILYGGSNHEKFLQWLDNIAAFVNSIKTAEGVKIPIIFRPYHENTGFWFWWGAKHCTPEQYKDLWAMTYKRLQKEGASQLLYAYSPQELTDTTHYLERYPGDNIIDIIGTDLYQFNDSVYQAALPQQLQIITDIASAHGKIAALTETGLEGITDTLWWTQKLLPAVKKYPLAWVLVWRNACDNPKHFYAPYPGQLSAPDFIEFYNHHRTLFLKDTRL